MRGYLSFPLLLATVCVSAQALAQSPNVPDGERKGFDSFTQDSLHHDVGFLASDHLQGRMSMQPGDDLAVQWIAGQFAKAGLDPVGLRPNGMPGYEQSFKLIEYRPDRANSTVTLMRAGKPTVWHAPEAFGAYKTGGDITAPVVFAGYGITAPELKYDDYTGLDVKGKIVLIFDHEPQEDDPQSVFYGTGNTKYATSRVKILNAQQHGAVAVITVAEPNRKHLTNAERVARIGGSTVRATPLPLQAIADDEVSIPLVSIVDDVAKEFFATSGTTPGAQQSKIDSTLLPQGLALPDTTVSLHLHNISEDDGRVSNVVGLLKGTDPTLKAETIIISAHHDHDGNAPCADGSGGIDDAGAPTPAGPNCMQTWHGADDNASGTAGVIAIARAFAANGVRPKRSILFVVFASEERGLLGSYWMAQHPLRPLATTRAVINFDMIGRDEKPSPQTEGVLDIPADTTNRLNIVGAEYSPDYAQIVAAEDNGIGLTLDDRFDHEHILNVMFRSDQFPFLLRGIPAMWWFTGFHPDYHHITDTAEKLDYAKMAKILQLAYLTAWRFGSDSTVPKFVENPPPPPPAPVEAPATADAPAAATPEKPHHHRPVTAVNLGNSTATEDTTPPAVVPAAAPVALPPAKTSPASTDTPPDVPPSAPIAPVATTETVVPVESAPHRPVAPVQIKSSTVAPTDPQAPDAGGATAQPATTPAPGVTPPNPGTTRVIAPVDLPKIPPQPTAAELAAKRQKDVPKVQPVKLGGKQPGQDKYEDPQ